MKPMVNLVFYNVFHNAFNSMRGLMINVNIKSKTKGVFVYFARVTIGAKFKAVRE